MFEVLLGGATPLTNPLLEPVAQEVTEIEKQTIVHKVEENETLEKIGKVYDVDWKRIFYKNTDIDHQDRLEVGVELTIPETDEELEERALHPQLVNVATTTPSPVRAAPVQPRTSNPPAPARKSGAAPAGYYDWGWCTYGAWSLTGWAGPWGDAHLWDDNARRDGHVVSSIPTIGSIFVDNSGRYGHVGVVVAVNGATVTVKDMNYQSFGQWTTREVATNRFVYIYP